MRKFIVSEDLLAETVKYLKAKPYEEVEGLMRAFTSKSEHIQEYEPEVREQELKVVDDESPKA